MIKLKKEREYLKHLLQKENKKDAKIYSKLTNKIKVVKVILHKKVTVRLMKYMNQL